MLSLVPQVPLILNYHNGAVLSGNITVNILWYGNFSPNQRSIIITFFSSLSKPTAAPSVSSWWSTTAAYKGGIKRILLGEQIFDTKYSLGKSLKDKDLETLAAKACTNKVNEVNFVLTASDVAVEDFCMNRCGSHGKITSRKPDTAYAWVGNSVRQCLGQCAWPFYIPTFGPRMPPLVAPNGDVGVDGMVISIATVLAGAVTNPFDGGYYQGPSTAPLEAVSTCTGMFGKGAFPGYPGVVLVDKKSGASYNAKGLNGRAYMLPAMWDPKTKSCKTLV